jgi:hypothetical protein
MSDVAIPFKKGDVVKWDTGFPANVFNVIEGVALILDNDPNGNAGMYRIEADDAAQIAKLTRIR